MESRVSKGTDEVLFKEGDRAESLYIVKRGYVLCVKKSKDRLIPVFKAGEGDIVGERAMLEKSAHGYSAVTLTPAELIEIDAANFREIFGNSPEWLVNLTETMIQRFENTASLIAENRLISDKIIEEEEFPSSLEVQFKKLLN